MCSGVIIFKLILGDDCHYLKARTVFSKNRNIDINIHSKASCLVHKIRSMCGYQRGNKLSDSNSRQAVRPYGSPPGPFLHAAILLILHNQHEEHSILLQ